MKVLKINDSSLDEQIRSTGRTYVDGSEFSYEESASELVDFFNDPMIILMGKITGRNEINFNLGSPLGVFVDDNGFLQTFPTNVDDIEKIMQCEIEYVSVEEFTKGEVLH